MPVSKRESSRARTIANADSESKSRVIAEIKASGDVITPHRVAKDLKREEQRRQAVKDAVIEDTGIEQKKKYRVFKKIGRFNLSKFTTEAVNS